jgi:methylated-DNA-protein-cysteine methyltransferase-like protein
MLPRAAGPPASRRRGRPENNPAIQEIWAVIAAIPRGTVSTYGAVARAAGLPGRARLTGFALRISPPAMHLPWHRVVGAGGRIAFPASSPQFREQVRRLRSDGVPVKEGRVSSSVMADLDAF